MQSVFLKMGQSTVLRFRNKPSKVVVGNSNYFNVEFVGNDLTIQPLQNGVTSNLFVYTSYKTFGFIMKVGNKVNYDDLINVRWKNEMVYTAKPPVPKIKVVKIGKTLELNGIAILLSRIQRNDLIGTYLIDLEVGNLTSELVNTNLIEIYTSRNNVKLLYQKHVFDIKNIPVKGKCRLRVFVKAPQVKGFSLNISIKGKRDRFIVTRNYL